MEENQTVANTPEYHLTSPTQTPINFTIQLSENPATTPEGYEFIISGSEPETGKTKTEQYYLPGKDHQAYLYFFEKLARDFGLRLPQNKPETFSKPSFQASLQEVLSKNLNPDILYGYGDPAVIQVKDEQDEGQPKYYLVATSNDAPHAFPIIRSNNLWDWEFVNFVFPEGQKPAWAANGALISDYWAPEMHQFGEEFRIYFVARDKHTHELCIGKAHSPRPDGPFVPDPEPILRGNVIDPHVYVQDAETAYLYWKEDNNAVWPSELIALLYQHPKLITALFPNREDQITATFMVTLWPWLQTREPMERFLITQVFIESIIVRYLTFYEDLKKLGQQQTADVQEQLQKVLHFMKTPVYAQQLSPDGSGLIGEKVKIIQNDLAWEAHLVEGIWVTRQQDKYYLFYAGNDFSTDQYGIGVAIADSPLGPFRKMETPFLQSTTEWWAPGHPSVTTDPDGKPVLILHAYFPEQAGYKQFRAILAAHVTFTPDMVMLD
ncbi:family 43 glycosylhydrolase [Adhaeribacter swui]|uniref:Family 43 glycosylhydrolase n=1 Tax=Adhaeribacter swui TaxID=2086471 RepID=A0A7G7GDY2_9BACT|nr:family 43 glycosylhydrolase [Adhaeribacter swui]QNF35366.1 family 43 glycosylhydrolase [Adhaeribacter swui]